MCLDFRSVVVGVVVVEEGRGYTSVNPVSETIDSGTGADTGGEEEEEGMLICGGLVVYRKLSLMLRVGSTRLTI